MKVKLLLLSLFTTLSLNAEEPIDLDWLFDETQKNDTSSEKKDPGPPNTGMMQFLMLNMDKKPTAQSERIKELEQQLADLNKTAEKYFKWGCALEDELIVAKQQAEQSKQEVADRVQIILGLRDQLTHAGNHINELRERNEQLVHAVDNPGSLFDGWVYTPEMGWLFINPVTYPYYFSGDNNCWMFYEQGSNPRMIFSFGTREWIQLDTSHMEQLYDGTFDNK